MQSHCMTNIREDAGVVLAPEGLVSRQRQPSWWALSSHGRLQLCALNGAEKTWEEERGWEVWPCDDRKCLWHAPVSLTKLTHWQASTARSPQRAHELDDYITTQFTGFSFKQYLHRPDGKWRLKVQHNLLLFHSDELAAVVAVAGRQRQCCVCACTHVCALCSKGWQPAVSTLARFGLEWRSKYRAWSLFDLSRTEDYW